MNNIDYSAYAALLIDAGLNFRQGMSLTIGTGYDGYPLARLCAQTAYARGARMVEIRWNDEHILRSRIENQTGNFVPYPAGSMRGSAHWWTKNGPTWHSSRTKTRAF